MIAGLAHQKNAMLPKPSPSPERSPAQRLSANQSAPRHSAPVPSAPRTQLAANAHAHNAAAPRPGLFARFVHAIDSTHRRENLHQKLGTTLAMRQEEPSDALLTTASLDYLMTCAKRLGEAHFELSTFNGTPDVSRKADTLLRRLEADQPSMGRVNYQDLMAHSCYLPLAYPFVDFSRFRNRNVTEDVKTLSTAELGTLCAGKRSWQTTGESSKVFNAAKEELLGRRVAEQVANLLAPLLPAPLSATVADYATDQGATTTER